MTSFYLINNFYFVHFGLDEELGSTTEERNVNIAVPPMTRQCVLIPAGLPLDSLSAPIAKPAASAMPMSTKNRSSYPVGTFSKTNLSSKAVKR
jgi:hypothetical protein